MTILFFTEISWFGLHQRPQHIALALAKRWPVLWVEPTTLLKKSHFRPVRVEENLHVLSVPEIPYNARYKFMMRIARPLSTISLLRTLRSAIQLRLVRRALRVLDRPADGVGVVVHNFHTVGMLDKLHPTIVLFDYIDNAFGFTSFPRHVTEEWIRMVKEASLITVTSPALTKLMEPYRTEVIHYIGNGVEFDRFSAPHASDTPHDIPTGKPVVGYVGAVYPWLDYGLLRRACSELKECNFVIIGPIHPGIEPEARAIEKMGNIRFLGFRPYESIPSYLQKFDVCIIPFQKNALTAAVNPVKLYEYSAAGKPTVATDFSGDILQYGDKVFIARSAAEFVARIKEALAKGKDGSFRRILQEFAKGHDWKFETEKIVRLIEEWEK